MTAVRSLRVLIAEDEPHIARLLQNVLQHVGHRVTVVHNGSDALSVLEESAVDAVVLDIEMPKVNGFEVLKWIRQDPLTASIPVVILTAKDTDRDMFDGYRYGADLYLTKPFDPTQLLHALSNLSA